MKRVISVIIPVYNVEAYLPDLLRSIEDLETSSEFDLRFIFVNDCSKQNEASIINSWKKDQPFDIHHILHQDNFGLAGSRNSGIQYDKIFTSIPADYYIWMDSDDIFTKDSILKRYEFMEENPDIGFGYGSYLTFRGHFQDALRDNSFGDPFLEEFNYDRLFSSNILSTCGGIIRAPLFKGFDKQFRICEDYDFSLWHSLSIKFKLIPNFYAFYYRLRDNCADKSLSHDPNEQKFHISNNAIAKRRALKKIKSGDIDPEIREFNKIGIK